MKAAVLLAGFAIATCPAAAQTVAGDTFADGKDGAKIHTASGFACPLKMEDFRRDAVGESDPTAHADFCSYSAQDGVYGTIKLAPISGNYDPKLSLARDFEEQDATGGRKIAEGNVDLTAKGAAMLPVYTRTYETSKLEDLHYQVLFAGVAVRGWAVEAIVEFAEPRDVGIERDFLQSVYEIAESKIGAK